MGLDFYEKMRDVSESISILDAKTRGVSESISEKSKNVGDYRPNDMKIEWRI